MTNSRIAPSEWPGPEPALGRQLAFEMRGKPWDRCFGPVKNRFPVRTGNQGHAGARDRYFAGGWEARTEWLYPTMEMRIKSWGPTLIRAQSMAVAIVLNGNDGRFTRLNRDGLQGAHRPDLLAPVNRHHPFQMMGASRHFAEGKSTGGVGLE